MRHTLSDGRKGHFWWADNALIDDAHIEKMGLAAFAVYCVLLRHCDRKDEAFPSFQRIQEKTGLSRQGVSNAIKRLIQLGYIVKLSTGNSTRNSNTYEINNLPETSQLSRPVNSVDQSTQLTGTSQLSRPELVNSVDSKKTNRRRPIEEDQSQDRTREKKPTEPEQPATDSQTTRSVNLGESTAQQSTSVEGSYSATPRDHFADRVKHGSHRYPELCEQGLGHVWVGPGFNDFELATLKACQQHLQRHDRPAELGDAKTYLGNLIFQRKWGQIEQRHEEGRSLQSASAASRPVDPYAPTVNGMAPSDFDEIREFYKQQYDRREANG